jgi:putative peptidoglycan lipid II flippase
VNSASISAGSSSTARNSVTVAGWTILSRVVGLLRVLVIGAVMGPTYLANIFQAGYVLPGNVFTVMAGPVLAMVVVPAVVGTAAAGGATRAGELLSHIAGRLLAVAGVGTAALALLSPLLAWTLVFGVPEPDRGRAWLLTLVLVLFVAPQVVLGAIAALGVAAQQSRGRFALAAAAPAVESLGTIGTVVLTGWMFGAGLDIAQSPMTMMILLGAGTTASVALHAALQTYGAWRAGVLVPPRRGWRQDREAYDAMRRIVRSVPVAACPAITAYVLTVAAGTVPGGVLVVQLSFQVFYALSFVGARAVSMAALPKLAEAAAAQDGPRFAAAWRQGLHYAVLVSLPPLCLLATFAAPTADLLANGELRQSSLIAELAGCLAVIAFAQLAGGIHDLGRQALFSRLDDAGPRLASFVAVGVSTTVALSTLLLPADSSRLTGLTVAILAAEIAAAAMVLRRLRDAIRPHRLLDGQRAIAAGLATLAMLPVIVAGSWLLDVLGDGRIVELLLLLATGALSLAAFALALRVVSPRLRPES